ncbi:uncharacterized protein UMAG_05518 [Mycosarcoma maydis]|uniref:GATA-type domain-containing protein n=1 Tax=Mycosarcoma maydis TaxID=5270 RepID=A0A0D1DQ32_MYCMD|nr:uncharacterized protein UMAG_05518 [Ustilago maydis 521]KIS66524.1 hypothetical protein UMAG_05518 [Ustilago maydis 521]|eukprot:XP_011391839.1 hypothetical protein UMAG_05518 [Ustilago maydis 521]
MSASYPLINSPRSAVGRHPEMPYMPRPKRPDSAQHDFPGARSLLDPASRFQDISDEPTFIPTSLGEHLLERTYLEDVVRPLVRALVKARMTHGINGEGASENSQAYVDLEKLRRELERSTQRARHAEQERDDLARRLDLAGVPEISRERAERQPEHFGPSDLTSSSSRSQAVALKRSRHSDYEQRSSAPITNTVSVKVVHSDGPAASMKVSSDASQNMPLDMVQRNHPLMTTEQMSPPPSLAYGHSGPPRHQAFVEMHPDSHEADPRPLARMQQISGSALEADYAYPDERAPDRYGMPPAQSAHRPPISRFSGMGGVRSPPSSSAYLTSSSERSSVPTLTTYPSTSSSGSFAAAHYSGVHPYDHEPADEMERSRKMARTRPGEPMDHLAPGRPLGGGGTPLSNNYIVTPSSESTNYPVRKLASTKNRTCSNCAAPHDAKFRRGPNGPGTLCDRCGSRWKKFKEQESAGKRESQQPHDLGGVSASAAAGVAAASANARLSSNSASSQSPMEPGTVRADESSGANGNGRRSSALVSPNQEVGNSTAPVETTSNSQLARERSASVDQLMDE